MQEWDGNKWQKSGDWFEPLTDKVKPLLAKRRSRVQAEEQRSLAERTEACLN
jgi:hypothetical protein